jgi:hypothetical protein
MRACQRREKFISGLVVSCSLYVARQLVQSIVVVAANKSGRERSPHQAESNHRADSLYRKTQTLPNSLLIAVLIMFVNAEICWTVHRLRHCLLCEHNRGSSELGQQVPTQNPPIGP